MTVGAHEVTVISFVSVTVAVVMLPELDGGTAVLDSAEELGPAAGEVGTEVPVDPPTTG